MWILLTSMALGQTGIDAVENLFGATNVHAITGHGGPSVGVSAAGDITVLTWPGPATADQLAYMTSNAIDAREQPRFGAPESAGIVLGLWVVSGGEGELVWLRDGDIAQDYGPDDGPNVHTAVRLEDHGLDVTVVDVVHPEEDVLVRQVEVGRDDDSPVEAAWLMTYANLSPVPPDARIPELPFVDWAYDGRNDFAAAWDPSTETVVHFHPSGNRTHDDFLALIGAPSADWGAVGDALESGTDQVDRSAFGEGAWIVMGTHPAPDQHQVGIDETDWCGHTDQLVDNYAALPETFAGWELPIAPSVVEQLVCSQSYGPPDEWTWQPTDPFVDLQDGDLEGSDLAAFEVAEALRTPLTFDGDVSEASVVLAMGADETEARAAYEAVDDPLAVEAAAEEALEGWLDGLRIPGEPGTRPFDVARRALINTRVGTDRETGAVVASIARQPPYGLDWPRDGAFFNLMLDASGQSDLVDRRVDLYASWQRQEPVEATALVDPEPPRDPDSGSTATYPAYAWEMNYYPDGMVGGNLRFEIDTTAFAVWTMVAHVGWADDPEASLRGNWEAIRTGADLLARWEDPETGLHAPAQEDDNAEYAQTLHGAITVFGALDMAARAARYLGEDSDAEAWEARAAELQDAILTEFWDPEDEHLFMEASGRGPFAASGRIPTGPSAWAVWPLRVLPWSDERIRQTVEYDQAVIEPIIALEKPGGSYFMKNTLSAAMAEANIPALEGVSDGVLEDLASHATPTDHYGEVMVVVDGAPDQRTANPHLWEGCLFWLTAMAIEDPAALEAWNDVLPPSRVVVEATSEDEDARACGCRSVGGPLGTWGFALFLVLATRRGASVG